MARGRETIKSKLKLFISHSSRDADLVRLLINLLKSALKLSAAEIRCTSVDGYRLPVGADTVAQLRREVHDAEGFIGVISPASLASMYVAFELGARWGAHKNFLPILAPGVDAGILSGPLREINVLSCDSAAQLHQLIHDLAKRLDRDTDSPAAFQVQIDEIVGYKSSYLNEGRARSAPLLDEVRLDAARDLLRFLSRVLNREAPDGLKDKYAELRDAWAVHNRQLYLLHAPEDLREKLDDRMVQYLRSLREYATDPTTRAEVERQRDLAKRETRQLLSRLRLAANW